MTTTPSQPDLQKVLNNLTKRIRDLERRPSGIFQDFYVADDCVYWRGEGSIDSPYHVGISIDPDGTNQLVCAEDGLFVGGSAGTFDAVVDSTFTVSDPETRQFRGIGEALDYLADTLGMINVIVLVRANEDITDYTTYTETANWTSPGKVTLVGVGRATGMTNGLPTAGTGVVRWRMAGFTGGASEYYIRNIYLDDPTIFSGNALFLDRCAIGGDGGDLFTGDFGIYTECYFTGAGVKRMGTNVLIRGGHFGSLPSSAFTIATTFLYLEGTQFRSGGDITVPVRSHLKIAPSASGVSGGLIIRQALSIGGSLYVENTGPNSNISVQVVITGGGTSTNATVVLINCYSVTTSANTGGHTTILGQLNIGDITGPANMDVHLQHDNGITLRGRAINAKIVQRTTGGTWSGTAITGVALINSIISAALEGGGAAAGAKPYALDASSLRNILHIAGASLWPSAGTDAGTDNQIVTS